MSAPTHVTTDANYQAKEVIPTAEADFVQSPDGLGGVVIVQDGDSYKVKQLDGPKEGRREHVFHSVRSFGRWLEEKADPSETEILVDQAEIQAVLDPGHHAPEIVSCALVLHPVWQSFLDKLNMNLNQTAVHDLIRGFREYIVDGDQLLQAVRVVKLGKGSEIETTIGAHGETKLVTGGERADLVATVPESVTLRCPIYQGIERRATLERAESGVTETDREIVVDQATYDIELLVTIDVDESTPRFRFTCPLRQVYELDARRDAAAFLEEIAGEGFMVNLGALEVDERLAGYEPPGLLAPTD